MQPTRSHSIRAIVTVVITVMFLVIQSASAQVQIDTMTITSRGDTARFWMQVPTQYDSSNPPTILIWWHQLGGTQYEMRDFTEFDTEANARGWIAASHFGPNDRHWNTTVPQEHCQAMLDWIRLRYPFSMDSIYMIGGSMGGAAGQVWHNNHCGEHGYFIAATAGASQILDCQLRQEQYLAGGDTNRSMRAAFGGLPDERDSVAFEYHRASAIHVADTSQSMHFNSLHLPVWSTWGNSDGERMAYGEPAAIWAGLRSADGADTTFYYETEYACHGLQCMPVGEVCDWLTHFTANRYPDNLSINADQGGEYYWTQVALAENDTIFGRYGVVKRPVVDGLDITLARNILWIRVNTEVMNLGAHDTLRGTWQNLDATVANPQVRLSPLPPVESIHGPDNSPVIWAYDSVSQTAYIVLIENGSYEVALGVPLIAGGGPESALPAEHRLTSVYPNPFNSETTFVVESPGGQTELILYDLLGRIVSTMTLTLSAGSNNIPFDGASMGSGVFFAKVSGSRQPPMKILLLR
jgi:hypothetical protein